MSTSRPTPRMVTRPRNAETHPGNLIPKQKRRTKEEMKEERAGEAEKKIQEERKKEEALERVARLEARMKASDFQANQLPEKKPPSDESSGDEGQLLVPEAVNKKRCRVEKGGPTSDSDSDDSHGDKAPTHEDTEEDTSQRSNIPERNPGRCLRRTKAYTDIRQVNDSDRGDDSEVSPRSSDSESDEAEVPAKKRRKVIDKGTIRRALKALQDGGLMGGRSEHTSEREPADGRIKNWAAYVSAKQTRTKTPATKAPPPSLVSRTGTGIDSSHTAFSAGPKASIPISIPDLPVSLSSDSDQLEYANDEEPEGLAALSSTKMDGKRLTSTTIVKIEPSENAQVPVERINSSKRVDKFKNRDLPTECHIGNAWRRAFIPTYIRYIASLKNPWIISDDDAVQAMKLIWDVIYPTVPYMITPRTSVFYIANQRVYEWRNGFGSTALAVVNSFFDSQDDLILDERRVEFASAVLKDLMFLFENTDSSNPKEWRGAFRSPFILQVFAFHLMAIQGHKKVPGLGTPGELLPRGAVGLTAASVERAFSLWTSGMITVGSVTKDARSGRTTTKGVLAAVNKASGKMSLKNVAFSESNWGLPTRKYMLSISRMKDQALERVIDGARPHVTTRSLSRFNMMSDEEGDQPLSEDERALLVNLSDMEDEW